ncbi:hypothetical protein FJR45_02655 [Sulfurimonas sediminis]|uniref:Uncharacterized protein n=1 Tax=Sulfurimonas sediminis TaxID=2590020 RepID=A0A7M1AZH5_9BACT|nr:hypothetical protein [Sulfurimonas sediminis]QOP42907.1 hypothetical protein FJR45_02655 [Sulfurimonas sediminis]
MTENAIVLLEHEHTVVYDGQKPVFDTKNKNPELFTAVVIPLKYIHSFSFKIANTISDDELAMKTELKMYKEGGLDVQKEYRIDFIKYELDHEYLIEAFALSLDDFTHYLADFSYKIDVVDFAFPRFLAYEALYKTEETKKSNDLYIYISDDEAFGAIYQNGKYIGHRIINSLNAISKRTGLELVKLKEYLKEKGFKRENYGLEETLILDTVIEVFSKDIEKIVYSINHKRGLFGLTGIDRVVIDFEGHTLEGIGDFFSQYGFEPVIKPLTHQLSILLEYLFGLHQGADFHQVNLTHLERKKPLSQYTGFRYLVETLITIVLLLGIGIFVSYYLNQQQEKITLLEVKAKERKKKIEDFSLRLKKIKKKNDQLLKEKEGLEDKIFVYETTFRVIPMIGQIGIKRQKMMNDILRVLKKYRLSASSLFQKDEKRFEIQLISQSDTRGNISKFMHDLIELGYKNVMTKDITYEDGVYTSKIYISVKEVE